MAPPFRLNTLSVKIDKNPELIIQQYGWFFLILLYDILWVFFFLFYDPSNFSTKSAGADCAALLFEVLARRRVAVLSRTKTEWGV